MLSERLDVVLRRFPMLMDGAVAATLCLFSVAVTIRLDPWRGWASVALLAPLALRRRFPVVAAGLVLWIAFLRWLLEFGDLPGPVPGDIAVPMVVYSVTAYGPRWARRVALGAGLLGAGLAATTWPQVGAGDVFAHVVIGLFCAISVLAAWAFGRLRGVRRERMAALQERARLLEVERDQRARLAVSAERARIAREMHDIVAHSLAVVIAQADGGRYAATDSPQAQAVLNTIGETGRTALAEMRRLLAVLRDEAPAGETGLGPQPGLGDVPQLVRRVVDGGLVVTLHDGSGELPLEPGIGLVVYRIVQEGLTNVIKHAGPQARAWVTLRRAGTALEVDVVDDGRGAGAQDARDVGGHGLIGMRERAAAYGGVVEAGPLPGGGYAVRARIPLVTS